MGANIAGIEVGNDAVFVRIGLTVDADTAGRGMEVEFGGGVSVVNTIGGTDGSTTGIDVGANAD